MLFLIFHHIYNHVGKKKVVAELCAVLWKTKTTAQLNNLWVTFSSNNIN